MHTHTHTESFGTGCLLLVLWAANTTKLQAAPQAFHFFLPQLISSKHMHPTLLSSNHSLPVFINKSLGDRDGWTPFWFQCSFYLRGKRAAAGKENIFFFSCLWKCCLSRKTWRHLQVEVTWTVVHCRHFCPSQRVCLFARRRCACFSCLRSAEAC